MRIFAAGLAGGLALALGGCASSIHVARLDPDATPTAAPTGVPWNLAMTQYTVTITRQVTSCGNKLNGTVTVSAVAGKKLDEEQQYVLRSSGVWATADITSTLAPDGTSLGLNAHSEDQTAAVIGNTVGLLSAVATSAGSFAAGEAHFTCSDAVRKALAVLNPPGGTPLQDQVSAATRAVAAATYKVSQLTPLYQGGGGGGAGGGQAPDKKPLADAINDLITAQETLNDLQATLATKLNTITAIQVLAWPPRASVSQSPAPFRLDPAVAQSWVKWEGLPPGQANSSVGTAAFDVWLGLYRSDGNGGWVLPTSPPRSGDLRVGVPVRLPRPGRLLACSKSHCSASLAADWVPGDAETLLVQPDAPVLQFGQLYNVPLTGGTFKSEGAVIALDANGVPTSIQVTEKQAAAAVATAAARDAANAIAALPGQIAGARLARTQAATNQISAENALAAAQAAQPTIAGTAAANAQAAFLNATTALATARANADAAGELGQLAAQTALARQQAELAAQQSALAVNQANAALAPALSTLAAQTALIAAQAAQINAEVAKAKAQAELAR
jgi:hypothetical protein